VSLSPELITHLAGDSAGGLLWLKAHANVAEIGKAARSREMAFFHLEGQRIEKKDQFLNHAAIAMKFPDHFGKNWDAFYDCLTDLDWVDGKGFVIYFDHTDAFAEHNESQLETVIELFEDAVNYWASEGRPMTVLLSGQHAPAGVKKI
jgi:RNAse (barnase) inhibitor barstar